MKGSVKNPVVCWILSIVTLGVYGLVHMYSINAELRTYLEKSDEEVNPTKELVISLICFLYYYVWVFKTGKLIYEAQLKAGIADAKDTSIIHVILHFPCCLQFGVFKLQSDLNKAWEA